LIERDPMRMTGQPVSPAWTPQLSIYAKVVAARQWMRRHR
jgi:hypothetical protein